MPSAARIAGPLIALALAAASAGGVTITVDTTDDLDLADGFCSLREAMIAANTDAVRNGCLAGAGEDRIAFDLTLPAILQLGQDLPVVTGSLAVRGPSVSDLTIDGMDLYRLFVFDTPSGGGIFVLEDLTLTRGRAPHGTFDDDGGALVITAGERAFVERVVFRDNSALNGGGAVTVSGLYGDSGITRAEIRSSTFDGNRALDFRGGGAIEVVDGELYLADSTLTGNSAEGSTSDGGALSCHRSTIDIERSTIVGNRSDDDGGAIAVVATGLDQSLRLVDSTITGNQADDDADDDGRGGGIHCASSVGITVELRLVNNVIAENSDTAAPQNPNLYTEPIHATLITTGWNLIGDNTGATALFPAGNPNAQGNFVGTSAAPIDPRLEALGDNGGPTETRRPLLEASSPVIDHGYCPDAATDQRGWGDAGNAGRIFDHPTVAPNPPTSDGCDIGAVERGASPNAGTDLFASDFEDATLLHWSAAQP